MRYIAENNSVNNTSNKGKNSVLLINDAFGALAVNLHELSVDSWSDSYLSQLALAHNFEQNELASPPSFISSTTNPAADKSYDLVIIKIPKTMALLEDQLIRLKAYIRPDTRIIAAAMSKHIHASTLALFEKIIGTTTTSLAVKKARLIFSTFEQTEQNIKPIYPKTCKIDALNISLVSHANVFAKDKLDYGAKFFIKQFKTLPKAQTVIDLGCGNGVLGIMAQHYLPMSTLCFIDESYMAVESAKASYKVCYPDKSADFLLSNSLSAYQGEEVDLIVCNPPFHQEHVVGDYLAWKMFEQSLRCLKRGGQLWVVANRHLKHHSKLKRLFGNSRIIDSNKQFVVLSAKKR